MTNPLNIQTKMRLKICTPSTMKNNIRFYKINATRKYLQQGGMGMDYQKFVNNAREVLRL